MGTMHGLVFCGREREGKRCFYVAECSSVLSAGQTSCLEQLLEADLWLDGTVKERVVGPRRETVSPWSTNACDILRNVGISGVSRIEQFFSLSDEELPLVDPMTQEVYQELTALSLVLKGQPEPLRYISDIAVYNQEAGLALSRDEIAYLESVSQELGRSLTDAELFGFGQVNSEHCRHKIFNGRFVIDEKEQPQTLFTLIKETSRCAPHNLVSAYKDNVAFLKGPRILQFAPEYADRPGFFRLRPLDAVLSLKAETHNFPTTVEPFAGASTGSGGEIRDRMAGGRGSLPLAGTAVYITAYSRLESTERAAFMRRIPERRWLYQSPAEILRKASNGASDFGNKFGQPLIAGSLYTFECQAGQVMYAFDRCIMLAGGVGYADANQAEKSLPRRGDKVVLLGGDNYRIGMAGGSVSSVGSGEYARTLELSAVQRANPEMQKRAYNVLRALCEMTDNPVRLVHDHGAGGHMNCFTELVEPEGGRIFLDRLPVGDRTLSVREIVSNESQERMGLVIGGDQVEFLQRIAARERSPMYLAGEIDGEKHICFETGSGEKPVDLPLKVMLGNSPAVIMKGETVLADLKPLDFRPKDGRDILETLEKIFSLEGVGCKDWLTNKVDRSVTGKVCMQQCVGPLQLPLADCGVMALDYSSLKGIATAIGHAPAAGIADAALGARLALAEALSNIVWAPLKDGLKSLALSANWMWPCKRPGEDARLYRAVEALSQAAISLGLPIPTGKDSLSMTMKYPDGSEVRAPGTVIVSAAGEVYDIRKCVTPDLKDISESLLLYINFSGSDDYSLGAGSLSQVLGEPGKEAPQVDFKVFGACFAAIQELLRQDLILAGHDISAGGLLTSVCEMAFGGDLGVQFKLDEVPCGKIPAVLFSEQPGVIIQIRQTDLSRVLSSFDGTRAAVWKLGVPLAGNEVRFDDGRFGFKADLGRLRRSWFKVSALFDALQTAPGKAQERYENFERNRLQFVFPAGFSGLARDYGCDLERAAPSGLRAAIVREQGTNGDREMAFSLFSAGFDVKDVAMSDIIEGREDLSQISFAVFPGGFANSDVLGAGRGWAAAFLYNKKAMRVLENFFQRSDTLSLGVCNGCQLMVALGLLYPEHSSRLKMLQNASGKFESAFLNVEVQKSRSVLLGDLAGSRLGIWVAHGEGRFCLPEGEESYDIPLRYISDSYPASPNGADFRAAGVCSADGRHLAMMPHLERALLPWQWAYYPQELQKKHEVSPWMLAFVNARKWVESRR